jgi:uncharacterized protein YkwD
MPIRVSLIYYIDKENPMRKYFTYKSMLVYSILLLLSGIITYNTGGGTPNPYESSVTEEYNVPTLTPIPKINSIDKEKSLLVRNTMLQIGDSTDEVIRKLGFPSRISETEYDFTYYIYNNDYKKLLFVALLENEVVGFYTDALDFEYHGFGYGATVDEINAALEENFSLTEILTKTTSGYKVSILMDKLETGTAVGIYVLSDTLKEDGYNEELLPQVEQIVYDLTNSIRVRNGLEPLSWSSSAGQAARKHSMYMAAEDFFSHVDPSFRSPGDRLNAEGISYKKCGENIIAGYGNAILSSHGWYNSESHRKNLLNQNFRYLGVGFIFDKDSIYKTYITQNFYR